MKVLLKPCLALIVTVRSTSETFATHGSFWATSFVFSGLGLGWKVNVRAIFRERPLQDFQIQRSNKQIEKGKEHEEVESIGRGGGETGSELRLAHSRRQPEGLRTC